MEIGDKVRRMLRHGMSMSPVTFAQQPIAVHSIWLPFTMAGLHTLSLQYMQPSRNYSSNLL